MENFYAFLVVFLIQAGFLILIIVFPALGKVVYDTEIVARVMHAFISLDPFPQAGLAKRMFGVLLMVGAYTLIVAVVDYLIHALKYRLPSYRYLASVVITYFCGSVGKSIRSSFHILEMPVLKKSTSHTHPTLALLRESASAMIRELCVVTMRTPFYYQASARNQCFDNNREFYWAKDVTSQPSNAKPTGSSIIAMLDVDYYVDMPEFLLQHGHAVVPIVLFTFVPTTAGATRKEYSYAFYEESVMGMQVAGGAAYRHKLWNYGYDNITVADRFRTVTYRVERKTLSADHQLILLEPMYYLGYIGGLFHSVVTSQSLNRLEVVDGDFARLDIQTAKGRERSTARIGTFCSVTIPAALDDALVELQACSSVPLGNSTVRRHIELHVHDDKERHLVSTAAIISYLREIVPRPIPTVYPTTMAVRRYKMVQYGETSDNARPSLTAFMSPIIHEAYAPDVCPENEHVSIQHRVIDVATNCSITRDVAVYIREFINVVGASSAHLVPVDIKTVQEKQARPSQKQILKRAENSGYISRVVNCFMKREAYAEYKDPRNITIFGPRVKMLYSQYMYAVSEWLKTKNWYAFGKAPLDVAARVADILVVAKAVLGTDFSRMDGRVSAAVRAFEIALLIALFGDSEELRELHNAQYNNRGFGKFGFVFEQHFSRGSGSLETSPLNSCLSAFIAFIALRLTGLSPEEAVSQLGIYGGDDGLTVNVPSHVYDRAAAMLGQVSTSEHFLRYEPVKFLARIYGPDTWTGEPNSMCDIKRQLSKFHTTVNLPTTYTCKRKLVEKSYSFFLTDRNTPILGQFVSKVMDLAKKENYDFRSVHDADGVPTSVVSQWMSRFRPECQWRNDPQPWMEDVCARELPDFSREVFEEALNLAESLNDMLQFPLCQEPALQVTDNIITNDAYHVPTHMAAERNKVRAVPKTSAKASRRRRTRRRKRFS